MDCCLVPLYAICAPSHLSSFLFSLYINHSVRTCKHILWRITEQTITHTNLTQVITEGHVKLVTEKSWQEVTHTLAAILEVLSSWLTVTVNSWLYFHIYKDIGCVRNHYNGNYVEDYIVCQNQIKTVWILSNHFPTDCLVFDGRKTHCSVHLWHIRFHLIKYVSPHWLKDLCTWPTS